MSTLTHPWKPPMKLPFKLLLAATAALAVSFNATDVRANDPLPPPATVATDAAAATIPANQGRRRPIPVSLSVWAYPTSAITRKGGKDQPDGLGGAVNEFLDRLGDRYNPGDGNTTPNDSFKYFNKTPFTGRGASGIDSNLWRSTDGKLRLDYQGGVNQVLTDRSTTPYTQITKSAGKFQLQTNKPPFSESLTVASVNVTENVVDLAAGNGTRERELRRRLKKAFQASFDNDKNYVVDGALKPSNTVRYLAADGAGNARLVTATEVRAGLTCNIMPAGSTFNLGVVFSTCECIDAECNKPAYSLILDQDSLYIKNNATGKTTWTSDTFQRPATKISFDRYRASLVVVDSSNRELWRTATIQGVTDYTSLITHIDTYGNLGVAAGGVNHFQTPPGPGDPNCGEVTPEVSLPTGLLAQSCNGTYTLWFGRLNFGGTEKHALYVINGDNGTARYIALLPLNPHPVYAYFQSDAHFVIYSDTNNAGDGSAFSPLWGSGTNQYIQYPQNLKLKLGDDGNMRVLYTRYPPDVPHMITIAIGQF